MSSRLAILSAIRRSLGVTGRERPRRMAVEERLDRAPKGVVPAQGQGSPPERLATFKAMAERAAASIVEVENAAAVPRTVATFLRDLNLPPAIRHGDDPRLADLPWGDTTLKVETGPSAGADVSAVSHALGGVAETGTLVLVSGEANPSTLNFLPDNHIVVLDARDILADYESLWGKVRGAFGKGEMPRTVNWITGPSRSADIEQTLLHGAHGPRRLHIVIVNE
jgi:L-lactate dehydrogenase complex protein LldG